MRYAIRVPAHLPVNVFWNRPIIRRVLTRMLTAISAIAVLLIATPLRAQQDAWDQAVQTAFTGTIAKGLSLVAIGRCSWRNTAL